MWRGVVKVLRDRTGTSFSKCSIPVKWRRGNLEIMGGQGVCHFNCLKTVTVVEGVCPDRP